MMPFFAILIPCSVVLFIVGYLYGDNFNVYAIISAPFLTA